MELSDITQLIPIPLWIHHICIHLSDKEKSVLRLVNKRLRNDIISLIWKQWINIFEWDKYQNKTTLSMVIYGYTSLPILTNTDCLYPSFKISDRLNALLLDTQEFPYTYKLIQLFKVSPGNIKR